MSNIFAIGVVVSAILGSFLFALLLEWLSLTGLMRLMPAPMGRSARTESSVALRIRKPGW